MSNAKEPSPQAGVYLSYMTVCGDGSDKVNRCLNAYKLNGVTW